jgi:hypothetical protein
VKDGKLALDLADELQAGVVITSGGAIVHPALAAPAPQPTTPQPTTQQSTPE